MMTARSLRPAIRRAPATWIPRNADGATIACFFVVALFATPAGLVISGIPLSLAPADVIALSMALWWLCAHFTTTLGAEKGRLAVRTALFCYAIALLATYGYATYGYLPPDELSIADHAAVLVVVHLGVALVMCDGVTGADRLNFVLKAVVVMGAVVAIIGALQFLLDFDLTKYLEPPGLRAGLDLGISGDRSDFRRVAATTAHPIEFGVLCAMVLPLATHYGLAARRNGQPSLRWWLCGGCIAAGLLFSVSRSAVLGLTGAALVLFFGWRGRRRLYALVVTAGFLLLTKLMVPGLIGTFYGLFADVGSDPSVQYRTHDYAIAATEIANKPWLGRGLGTWYAPKHQVFDNQYLLTLVETGVIGLVAFVAVFLCAVGAALRARYLSLDPELKDLGLTLAACLVVPLIGSATFDFLSFHTATGLAFLLVGAAGSLLRTALRERSGSPRADATAQLCP